VFYTDQNATGAGLLRLLAEVGTGSLSPQRLALNSEEGAAAGAGDHGDFEYRADLHASYDFLLSGDSAVTKQDGLGGGLMVRGLVNPLRTWSFGLLRRLRQDDPPNELESSDNVNRDINRVRLQLDVPAVRSVDQRLAPLREHARPVRIGQPAVREPLPAHVRLCA